MQQIEFETSAKNENIITAVHLDKDVFDYLYEKYGGNHEKMRILVNDVLRKKH
jgi:hypothetical protein